MTSFTSHERVAIQAGVQTIHGNVNYYSASKITHGAEFKGHFSNSSLRPVASYVARPSLQQKIKEKLHPVLSDDEQDTRVLVIYGLGGSGKSQLALNFVHSCRGDYASIFWIEAGQKETIERDYLLIYRLLFGRLSAGSESPTVKEAVTLVKSWFHSRSGRSLVIFDSADTIDNADDASYIDLNCFLPDARCVDVIITTRSSRAQDMTALEAVKVADMKPAEAAELFRTSAKLARTGLEIENEIMSIVEELGYLALAVTLAGSHVAATPRLSSNLTQYLPEYRYRRKQLLSIKAQKYIHRYGESVLGTWETSFSAIERQSPIAARLLSFLSFINFDDIFLDLFRHETSLTNELENVVAAGSGRGWSSFIACGENLVDRATLETAFAILQTYSLLQWQNNQTAYTMHKLVHAWGRDRLELELQRNLSLMALELLTDVISSTAGNLIFGMRLVPHVMANFTIVTKITVASAMIYDEMRNSIAVVGDFLYGLGRWSDEYEVRVFHFRKIYASVGTEHPSTLASMNSLALVLSRQGKYEQAEEMHRQVLGLRETVLGKEHPGTLTSMNNLAGVLGDQGKYEQAEEMYRQGLGLRETVLGKEHPGTLTSINNLAGVLGDQGKYEQAEEMHRQALGLCETVLGKEHPGTLTSMNNLAGVLGNQGKYKQAEEMHRQALGLRETVLGKEHPSTLTSMNNLATVFWNQGRLKEAEQLAVDVMEMRTRLLGLEHPDTLRSMTNLAHIWKSQGRDEDAAGLMRQAERLQRKTGT